MLDARFVLIGAAIQIVGSARYVQQTVRGRTIPHRLTWLLWSIAPIVAFAAELSEGVGLRSLMTVLLVVSPLAVLGASFLTSEPGRWDLTRFDAACGVLSLVGLALWQLTGRGNVAIAMSLLGDAFAAAPTIRKAILAPETESYSTYLGAALSALITLLTVRTWTFADVAWPAYILVLGTLFVVLVRFRAPARAKTDRM
jgi:hypothetical protein